MKTGFEDKALLKEPLIKWVKTFKYDIQGSDFRNLSQLFNSKFLENIMLLIKYSKKKTVPPNKKSVETVAERLQDLRGLMADILEFYLNTLEQIVMVQLPDLVKISESIHFEECAHDIRRLLVLILGCTTQCSLRDQYIERISQTLTEHEQQVVQQHYENLADNSIAADSTTIDLDDTLLHMHGQVTRLSGERLNYLNKYYDCFERHSVSTYDEDRTHSDDEYKVPILIKPVIPVEHGGQWRLVRPREKLRDPNSADRGEEDVIVIRYRPTVRLGQKLSKESSAMKSSMGLSDKDKLRLKHANEVEQEKNRLEQEIQRMQKQLHDLEFNKKRVKELHDDNSKLIIEKQRLQEQFTTTRKKEEDLIDRLVEAQMKLEESVAEREQDRKRIEELMQSGAERSLDDISESDQDSLAEPKQKRNKLKEYEREIEMLKTRLMEAQKQENQNDEKWKFLEIQKEKVDARRQLNEVSKENDELKKDAKKLNKKINAMEKELEDAREAADVSRSASDDQVSQLEDRIQQMTKQIMVLRKKGGKLGTEKMRDLEEKEVEQMYETLQELTTEVSRLKSHNKQLRQTCDKLKRDIGRIGALEAEVERLTEENRRLQQLEARQQGSAEVDDELRRQNIQLQVENKKLRRMIDTLRYTLMQVDPHNRHKYTYITSF